MYEIYFVGNNWSNEHSGVKINYDNDELERDDLNVKVEKKIVVQEKVDGTETKLFRNTIKLEEKETRKTEKQIKAFLP